MKVVLKILGMGQQRVEYQPRLDLNGVFLFQYYQRIQLLVMCSLRFQHNNQA